MGKRLYCDRHRADHVERCPRCLEEDLEVAVKMVLEAGLATGHAESCVELVAEVIDQHQTLQQQHRMLRQRVSPVVVCECPDFCKYHMVKTIERFREMWERLQELDNNALSNDNKE